MKIISNEIKKIFSLRMVGLILLISIMIYQLFIASDINHFPNGDHEMGEYWVAAEMISEYGPKMDKEEFQLFQKKYEDRVIEADQFFNGNSEFHSVNVYSYDDYMRVEEESFFVETNQAFKDIQWKYLLMAEGAFLWDLQAMEHMISIYEASIKEGTIHDQGESILPYFVFHNFNEFIIYVGICIMISVAFLLTPLFLKDRKDKVDYVQYASKHGRKLYKSKFAAGMISALIITIVELIIFFGLYRQNATSIFFPCKINSVFNSEFWLNPTFLQYIVVTVVLIVILSMITALLSMFVSSKVSNFVTGIGVQVMVMFILCSLTAWVLLNNLFYVYISKYLVGGIFIILCVTSITVWTRRMREEMHIDVIN